MHRNSLLIIVLAILAFAAGPSAAQDPVDAFITHADSAATAGGDDALGDYVTAHPLLVGAAVGTVLDVAFQLSLDGNTDGEEENVAFAERVATVLRARGGSRVPADLVAAYRSWTQDQRVTRTRAMNLETQAVAARGGGELERAIALYDSARALYEEIGDRRAIAVNRGSTGVAYWYTGDMDAVIVQYDSALVARRAIEDRILEGRTLNGLGSAYQQKGDYAKSIDYYTQAIDLRRRTGDLGGLGTSLTYLGNTYYLSGRLVDARDKYEEALPILERLGSPGQMVELLNGIATLYADMGRFAASSDAYSRGIEIAMTHGLAESEIPCRLNLADNYRRHARYAEALAQYARVDSLLASHPDANRTIQLLRGRGLTQMDAGDLDGAREDLLAGAKAAAALDEPGPAIGFQINIGVLYSELGAYDRALETGLRARQMAIDAGDARQYREAVVFVAMAQRTLGQHEASLASYREALEQDEYDGIDRLVVEDKVNAAMLMSVLGQQEEARAMFYDALAQSSRVGREVVWWIHLGIGETWEDSEPDSVALHYDQALELLEEARAELGAEETEGGFLSGKRRLIYEEVARYYAEVSKSGTDEWSQKAFRTVERARARRLLDRMSVAVAATSTPEEERILDDIYRLDPSAPGFGEDERRLRGQLQEVRRTRAREAFGTLAQPLVATIDDVRSVVPKGTVVLSYALGDSASLLWAIDRDGAELFELPPRSALEGEVTQLRDAIARPGAGDSALRLAARSLYRSLVAPAERRTDGVRRLVILPDGFLFEVPFEALLTADAVEVGDGGATADWSTAPFLGAACATLYAPSASVYVQLSRDRGKERHDLDLVAFGAPDYTTLDGDGANLSPLPYAEQEVTEISARVKDKKREVRTGPQATETALKEALRDTSPRVVHLATHGLVDAAEPGASSVVLARDPFSDDDGYLRAVEIAAMPCHAGVVVMSACESARGRVTRGEGVIGLSQAFLASGAAGVVASLWSVSDESTAELMEAFYERLLGKKKDAAEAMMSARAGLIAGGRFSHPFYWSPFIVMGNDRMPW